MKNGIRFTLAAAILVWAIPCVGSDELPPAAVEAVKTLYPNGKIVGVEQEREDGVQYYEVLVRDGKEKIELEVTADGAIGEVESAVAWDEVPENVQQRILEETDGTMPKQLELHHVRGVPSGHTFDPVSPPIVLYEVQHEHGGSWREFAVTTGGMVLTEEDDDSEIEHQRHHGHHDDDSDSDSSDEDGD